MADEVDFDLENDLYGDGLDLYGGLDDDTIKPVETKPPPQQQQQQQSMRQQQPQQQQQQQTHNDSGNNNGSGNNYDNNHDNNNTNPDGSTILDPNKNDQAKIFVGGLNWDTSEEKLQTYFKKFGPVIDCVIMRDQLTGKSRGFGFLTFGQSSSVDAVVAQQHSLDGKTIDPKRAIPRHDQEKSEKIFVGGVSNDVNEEEFREFFTQFGAVVDANLMLDRETGRPRGFGFVTFESNQSVDTVLSQQGSLYIKDKAVEVKRAQPKGQVKGGGGGGAAFNPRHAMHMMQQGMMYPGAMPYGRGYPPQHMYPGGEGGEDGPDGLQQGMPGFHGMYYNPAYFGGGGRGGYGRPPPHFAPGYGRPMMQGGGYYGEDGGGGYNDGNQYEEGDRNEKQDTGGNGGQKRDITSRVSPPRNGSRNGGRSDRGGSGRDRSPRRDRGRSKRDHRDYRDRDRDRDRGKRHGKSSSRNHPYRK